MVPTFVDAGVGEQGRSPFVVTKEFSNNFGPGALATDIRLAIDRLVDFGLQDFCGKCLICAEMYPAGATPTRNREVVRGVRRWHFDGDKSRRFWDTIAKACGICQYVCPLNLPKRPYHNAVRELTQRWSSMRTLAIKGHRVRTVVFGQVPSPNRSWAPGSADRDARAPGIRIMITL